MAKNLTESETYAANVTVPEPNDFLNSASFELPCQQLADRTNHMKGILDTFAAVELSGSSKADGANLDMSSAVNEGGFTVNATDLRVPDNGFYLVTVTATLQTDNAGIDTGLELRNDGTLEATSGLALGDNTAGVPHALTTIVQVIDAPNDPITVEANVSGGDAVSVVLNTGRLTVRRLKV